VRRVSGHQQGLRAPAGAFMLAGKAMGFVSEDAQRLSLAALGRRD